MLRGVKTGGCARPPFVFSFPARQPPGVGSSQAARFAECCVFRRGALGQIRQRRPLKDVCKSNVSAQFHRWEIHWGRAHDTTVTLSSHNNNRKKKLSRQFLFCFLTLDPSHLLYFLYLLFLCLF